jgi:glucose 1-dehydrogenase
MFLAGQTAIVTGASRGIGRAIALALAQAGANVAINFHSAEDEAQAVAAEIRREGREALLCAGDVADAQRVNEMVAATVRKWGRLDIAVANAAYSDREPFYEADLEGFRRTIDVTMWGAFNLLRAAARQMIEQKRGGSIVVISSRHAFVPVPGSMAYNMAKAAVDQMARTAATELIDDRIRVNILHPGWVDTAGERKYASDEEIQKWGPNLPWGRLSRPEEVARGVVFLCDPASDYITGSTLAIDGGIILPAWAKRDWHGKQKSP